MRTWRSAFVLVVAVALHAGCRNGSDSGLTGSWQLASGSVDGEVLEPADARRPITLEFTERGVSGVSGCNDYTGWAHTEGSRVDISRLGGTDMACAPEAMEVEQAYLEALRRVAHRDREDGQLRLTGPGVNVVFEARSS